MVMGFTLEIVFIGLVAFVPDPDVKQPTKITTLLLDATSGYGSSDGRQIPSHKPLMLYCCDNVQGGCTAADTTPEAIAYFYATLHGEPPPGGVKCTMGYGARALDGVSIGVDTTNITDKTLTVDPAFYGVPSLTEFDYGGAAPIAKVAPDFMADKPRSPYSDLLAANVVFTGAKMVGVNGTVHKHAKYYLVSLHSHKPGAQANELPEETYFDLSVDTSTVPTAQINLTSFRGAGAIPSLKLLAVNGQTTVPVYIVNIAECDLWLSPSKMGAPYSCVDAVTSDYNRGNHHFEVYYELARNRPPLYYRPVPVWAPGATATDATESAATDTSMAMFNPWFSLLTERPICPPAQLAP
jgi:hypothetical protein